MTAITGLVNRNRNKNNCNLIKIIPIKANEISIVIPVKNNQLGVARFLKSFFETQNINTYPKEIIIVDNNKILDTKIDSEFIGKGIEIKVFHCRTEGPGNARNVGWKRAKGKWIFFTDSDCIATKTMISGFLNSDNKSVGYAGNVKSIQKGPISKYYESQKILIPLQNEFGEPEYLITANALVYRKALDLINGFNPRIKIAAGEDVDLGIRLRNYGKLTYCPNAVVKHDFIESLDDFKKRFMRYGKGNRIVEALYEINLLPKPFPPQIMTSTNKYLSTLQYNYLKEGYVSVTNISHYIN
jgi:glycosyltransferase involved in cell wall biosynthesis